MRTTPRTAMLTLATLCATLATGLASTILVSGCGGKSSNSSTQTTNGTPPTHKHSSKPAY